jgi:signal recognition particle receptor subunit beta
MALFNHATKEVTAKLVYYGPGLCGKTSNLQWIHDRLAFRSKGKLVSLATQTDRTLFFDFLPLELGSIRGMRARVQIYTVPGQVFYEATRRMVLKGCDAVVFIADSQAAMLDANAESQRSLRQNLLVNEIDPSIPQVIQYNKRDLPTALPLAVLNERLNPRGMPAFEAVAINGTGVEETLTGHHQAAVPVAEPPLRRGERRAARRAAAAAQPSRSDAARPRPIGAGSATHARGAARTPQRSRRPSGCAPPRCAVSRAPQAPARPARPPRAAKDDALRRSSLPTPRNRPRPPASPAARLPRRSPRADLRDRDHPRSARDAAARRDEAAASPALPPGLQAPPSPARARRSERPAARRSGRRRLRSRPRRRGPARRPVVLPLGRRPARVRSTSRT